MKPQAHVDSYYAAKARDAGDRSPLKQRVQADVCVVGGGLAGLTTARELARAGKTVVVLETNRVGWGASGRNGGFVSAGYAAGMDAIEAKLGIDDAKSLYNLSREGMAYVRDTIAAAGADEIVGGQGWLKVLRHRDPDSLKRRRDRLREIYGVDVEFWETDRLRSVLASRRYHFALYDDEPFHVDPLAYSRLVAREAELAGAIIHEGSPASKLTRQAEGWQIDVSGGSVVAQTVVLAGSAYQAMERLWPALDGAVLPVATYAIASARLGSALGEAIGFTGCIADTRRAGDYYRIVDGDRLLWGGRITTRRSEPRQLAELLKGDIRSIYPQLGDFEIANAWSGLMGYALHKMPIIRPLEVNLWAVTAFGGHGMAATATGGIVAASAIAHGDDRWRLFQAFDARWAGGPAGRAATQLVYWGMQLRDRYEERFGRRETA